MSAAVPLSSPTSLADRLAHTSDQPSIDQPAPAASALRNRSGALHVAFVLLLCFVAYAGSEPAIGRALLLGRGPLLVVLGALGVATLLARGVVAPLVGLALLALGGGGLLALLDDASLSGLAPTFALSTALAEALALSLWLSGRGSSAAPLSLGVVAVTAAALAYLLDGGLAASSPVGIAAGGALAVAFVGHARYAEGALASRHGSGQLGHAALSRWVEAARLLFLWLIGIFLGHEDQRRDGST